jgi:hypothetical protein
MSKKKDINLKHEIDYFSHFLIYHEQICLKIDFKNYRIWLALNPYFQNH